MTENILDNERTYISTATTTQVLTGAGYLVAIIVGTTAAGAISVYDDVSGTSNQIAELKTSIAEGTYTFNCRAFKGLSVVTAAGSKITVVYRKV